MQDEFKDSRLKYVELPQVFKARAQAVEMHCKVSQKTCEVLGKILAKERPKTPQEFEKHEALKDFVLKTATNNEETLILLEYLNGFLQDILNDAKVLIDGAVIRDKLKDQSDTIILIGKQRDDLVDEIRERNKRSA